MLDCNKNTVEHNFLRISSGQRTSIKDEFLVANGNVQTLNSYRVLNSYKGGITDARACKSYYLLNMLRKEKKLWFVKPYEMQYVKMKTRPML